MNIILIFAWVWAAFIAMSFWESAVEGRNAWDKGKHGWKLKVAKNISLTKYHFFLFWVMAPLFMTLPLIIFGWDLRLFGILVSAYFTGVILEDFFWYVSNPVVKLREFGPKFSKYYPWLRIGRINIPAYYVLGLVIAVLSWYFLWR